MTKEFVLIHGAFAGPWCMQDYATFFRDRGWTVHVPALRYHDGDPKADPDPGLTDTSVMDYTNDIADFVQGLDRKPVILGHAIAGVVAQQVASRGLASAIVLINPNAPWGTLPETDDERAVPRTLMEGGPFWKQPMRVGFDLMAPFALNKMDEAQQHAVFDQLGAESGRVMFEMFFWMFDDHHAIKVDFNKVDCPVLVVSGAEDRAVNPDTCRALAARYGDRGTFLLVKDHAHFLFMEPGWEGPASKIETWLTTQVT
ncbi:alpha/beta hydrolase [Ruegeria sp. HKCCD6157]|uniref:alpha/beta hydrolase n=1 Tax=Ruegeria sp. HKCCD6157 TaxID=2690707 RepID=UPI001491A1A1|nr:alpha/beta hydrolase [Ruegeria sp. HKCCD6157]NOE26469.1 alpha/beta fold hydrolase [Ruegeria sp. HKCCD6157]